MTLNIAVSEDDIITKLKTIQGVDILPGEYTPDSYKPVTDAQGMFRPYLNVKFNPSYPSYDNGIAGPERDSFRATFSVYVTTPDDKVTRQIRDQVREKMLTNFQPSDSSSLRPTGGFSFVDSDLGYNRYTANVGFSYITNLS